MHVFVFTDCDSWFEYHRITKGNSSGMTRVQRAPLSAMATIRRRGCIYKGKENPNQRVVTSMVSLSRKCDLVLICTKLKHIESIE